MKKVRFLSALMAVCMMMSLLPVSALAADAEHTPDCAYVCTHEHDEGCGYYVHTTQTEPCAHTDDCGYRAADVYGVCDCGAEADDEGTLVHSGACASLNVVTPAAPCTHADGDETEVASEDADACTHICEDDKWVCAEGCPVAEPVEDDAALMDLDVENGQTDAAVEEIMALISELPAADSEGRVLAAYETEMNAAAAALDVLTEEQQALVENAADLAEVQKALVQYKGARPSDFISFEGYHSAEINIEVPYGTEKADVLALLPGSLKLVFFSKSYVSYPSAKAVWETLSDLAWTDKDFNGEVSGDYYFQVKSGVPEDAHTTWQDYLPVAPADQRFYISYMKSSSTNPTAAIPSVTVTVLPEALPEAQENVTVNMERLDPVSSAADRLTVANIPGSDDLLITHKTLSSYANQTYRTEKFVLAAGGTLTVTQTGWTDAQNPMSGRIAVADGITGLNLVLQGVRLHAGERCVDALSIGAGAQVALHVEGKNVLRGGSSGNGIGVHPGADLTITGTADSYLEAACDSGDGAGIGMFENNDAIKAVYPWSNEGGFTQTPAGTPIGDSACAYNPDTVVDYPTIRIQSGTVYAVGTLYGAGIGGGACFSGGNIVIEGTAKVVAVGGTQAAGIGGGLYGNGGNITIRDEAQVEAYGGSFAAGIGGGSVGGGFKAEDTDIGGGAGNVTITGSAVVLAVGGRQGSAIGRGAASEKTDGLITIDGTAGVKAYALGNEENGDDNYLYAIDTAVERAGTAQLLNGRFDSRESQLWFKYLGKYGHSGQPYEIDLQNLSDPAAAPISLELINSSTKSKLIPGKTIMGSFGSNNYRAFASTVTLSDGAETNFLVHNGVSLDDDAPLLEYAKYELQDTDRQFIFTVAPGAMTTRDHLVFDLIPATTIEASVVGGNGSISPEGIVNVSALDDSLDRTFRFTPAQGCQVDTVTVDGVAVESPSDSYTFLNTDLTKTHTIAVSFKTAPVTPPVDPGTPEATRYTITVKYVDETGKTLAPSYASSKSAGSRYDVSAQTAKVIEGYTIDRVDGAVEGTLRGNVTVTVYYKQNATETPDLPETDIPDEEPPLTDLPEVEIPGEDTPLAPLPEEEGDVVIVDSETPLGSLPQTGTGRSVDPGVTLGLLALTGSLALAGLTVGMKKRKDGEAAE